MSADRSGSPAPAPARRLGRHSAETLRLDPADASTTIAREWLRAVLRGVVADDEVDDAVLVASELIANSVEHTDSREIVLTVHIDVRGLVVQVRDQGPGLPGAWPVPGSGGRSRGLMMVGKLSSAVSSRVAPEGGAVVEAVIPIEGDRTSDA